MELGVWVLDAPGVGLKAGGGGRGGGGGGAPQVQPPLVGDRWEGREKREGWAGIVLLMCC